MGGPDGFLVARVVRGRALAQLLARDIRIRREAVQHLRLIRRHEERPSGADPRRRIPRQRGKPRQRGGKRSVLPPDGRDHQRVVPGDRINAFLHPLSIYQIILLLRSFFGEGVLRGFAFLEGPTVPMKLRGPGAEKPSLPSPIPAFDAVIKSNLNHG